MCILTFLEIIKCVGIVNAPVQLEESSAQVAAASAAWGWEGGAGGHSMDYSSRIASQSDAFFYPITQPIPTLQIGY